jgi:transmembrane sensor
VGKDSARPFEIHAQQGVTTALGTQFDVRVNGTAVEVSVLEGTVAVAADDTGKNGTPISVPESESVDYSRGGSVSALRAANSASILGWKAQRIVFNDVPLSSALREYNRYIQVPIVLGSPEMADRHINGVFRIGDEDAFLGALQRGMHLKATQTNTQTLLSTH